MIALKVILWVVLYSTIFTPILYALLRWLFRSPVPAMLLLRATAGTSVLSAALNFAIVPQVPDYGGLARLLYQLAFAALVQGWLISSIARRMAKLRVSFWTALGASLIALSAPFLLLAVVLSR
ncbi:MAG: hypothetical protein AAGF55_07110 [Pseudomonadota bacterium]